MASRGSERFAVGLALAGVVVMTGVASPTPAPKIDSATIVNSGSTNTAGYTIDVRSNGAASVTLRSRGGGVQSSPKPFTVTSSVTTRFFGDLKAARAVKATTSPCMKSASFGTSTHVLWHGWTSPDLDCPPSNAAIGTLAHDVAAIRTASGINPMAGRLVAPPPQQQP